MKTDHIGSAAPVTQNHHRKTWRSHAPKYNHLHEISTLTYPDLITSLTEIYLFYCARQATCIFADPFRTCHAAILFAIVARPSRFVHNWQGAECIPPAMQNQILTPKSGLRPSVLTCECTSRHNGVHFFDIATFQVVWTCGGFFFCMLVACWLQNVLGASSRHNGVHFFDIPTSKSVPNVRATAARTFWTSQLSKMLRTWSAFGVLTSKWASRHNSVQFSISHPTTWLRARHVSEI